MVFTKKEPKEGEEAKPKDGAVKKKVSKKARVENYQVYIKRVLKEMHPDSSITREAIGVVNSFVNHLFTRIATDAGKISQFNKKNTVTAREVEAAVSMIIPGDLAKCAVEHGKKSVTMVKSEVKTPKTKKAAA